MSRSLGLRCEKLKCMISSLLKFKPGLNLSLQWTVPGLPGESGLAAAPAVLWVQGNLTTVLH